MVGRLAEKLRQVMTERGLRQTELARLSGLTDSTVVLILNGGKARIDTVEKILKSIDKKWSWLDE